jgi:DNA-binding CsgD family transcriptional regulator
MELLMYVALLDRQGRTRWSNYGEQELREIWSTDKSFLDFVHPSDQQRVEEAFARCVIRGEPGCWTMRLATSDRVVHCHGEIGPVELGEVAAVYTWAPLPAGYQDFTEAELETLRLISAGVSVRQIAKRLGKEESTIDTRIRGLKQKLGRETLHGVVGQAARLGLLPRSA